MKWMIAVCCAAFVLPVAADDGRTVTMHEVDANGVGASVGEIMIDETEEGLVFTPDLAGLPAGLHGFHVHQDASCEPATKDGKATAAAAAGGHYDPDNAGKHGTPWGDGHRGDLPALFVAEDGTATYPVLAPRLEDDDLEAGRALIVHAGGDNHADHPEPLGGGGARVYCGVIDAEE